MNNPRYAIVAQLSGKAYDTHVTMEKCQNLHQVRNYLAKFLADEDNGDIVRIWDLNHILKRIINFTPETRTPAYALSVAYWKEGQAVNWLYITFEQYTPDVKTYWYEPTRQPEFKQN